MKLKELDCIIVGQGIAGSLLAYELDSSNAKILVVDSGNKQNSSSVAAGIFNPINLNTLKKIELADEMYNSLIHLDHRLYKSFNTSYFSFMPVIRLLKSNIDSDFKNLYPFINGIVKTTELIKFNNYKSAIELNGLGFMHINQFLDDFRKYLNKIDSISHDLFEYDKLKIENDFVVWNHFKAKKIIFCEGTWSKENPWFPKNAFSFTKGQLLIIQSNDMPQNMIIKDKIFILPIGNNLFKVGATYEREDISWKPSLKGKQWLLNQIDQTISCQYKIVEHHAGIRPNIRDRKPVIGYHPQFASLGFFNGMGSRGVLYSAYYSGLIAKSILENKNDLPAEVNISRFYK